MSASRFGADIFIGYGINAWRRRTRSPGAPRTPPGAPRTPARDFFARPAEHHSPLGINPTGLISVGSIFGTGRIFPLALNFFGAFYQGVCIEIRLSFPKESP
jgi:hypothetical protein